MSYRGQAGTFATVPLGWILHVQQGDNSPWGEFENAVSPDRRFSHGWVAKDGSSEQYAELANKSWAQKNGNDRYYAFETEGMPGEPLTRPQIGTLAVWHNFLHAADLLANADGQRGIGTHYMGGASFGGHSCPDPTGQEGQGPRSRQRQVVLDLAASLRSGKAPAGVSQPGTSVPTLPAVMMLGSTGAGVFALQHRLAARGYVVSIDGEFGPGTDGTVRRFQGFAKITIDGIVGRGTWSKLWTLPIT